MAWNWRPLMAAVGIAMYIINPAAADQLVGNSNESSQLMLAAASQEDKSYAAFFEALRYMESRGDYKAVNSLNFIGAYQFGEAALVDLGYVRRDRNLYDNNFSGGFTGKNGIRSVADFLNNPNVQDKAAQDWMRLMWKYIRSERLSSFAWKDVGGVTLSPSGMLAATHLLGTGGLKQFINSGGSSSIVDPYGMPIRTYVQQLADYEIPFTPGRPN